MTSQKKHRHPVRVNFFEALLDSPRWNRRGFDTEKRVSDDINSRKVRSAVSNGTKLLVDYDGRSPWGRRLKDLLSDLSADLGGADSLSEAEKVLIRRTAMLALQA